MDPAQRYTIDEFLAHPWCNAAPAPPPPPTPHLFGKDLLSGKPLDSPLLSAARGGRGHDGKSPGIATLKEAFDITYAVHRMEEEGARRRKYKGRGAGARGFLSNLNEDDEDGEVDSSEGGEETSDSTTGPPQRSLAGVKDNHSKEQGSSPKSTGTGRRSRGRGGPKEFELDMQAATLLGRRHKKGVGVKSPLSGQPIQLESAQAGGTHPSITPGGEYDISIGSPMHT